MPDREEGRPAVPVSVHLATSALAIALAAWVIAARPQDRANLALGAVLLFFGGFALIFGPLRLAASEREALLLTRVAVWYIIPVPFALLLLVDRLFLAGPRRPWQGAALALAGAVTGGALLVMALAPDLYVPPAVLDPSGVWVSRPTPLGNALIAAISFAEALALLVAARVAAAPERSALQRRQAAMVGLAFGMLVAHAAGVHVSSGLRLPFALSGEPGWLWVQGLVEAGALLVAARALVRAFDGPARLAALALLALAALDGLLSLLARAAAVLDLPVLLREAAGRPLWLNVFAVTLALAVMRYGLAGVAAGPRSRVRAGAAAVAVAPVAAMAGVAVLDAYGTGPIGLALGAGTVLVPFAVLAVMLRTESPGAGRLLLDADDPAVLGERAVRYVEALRAAAVRSGEAPAASEPGLRALREELGLTEREHRMLASLIDDPMAAGSAPPLLGRYRVERELGRGAFGTALLATDLATGGKVVLKRFHAGWADQRALAEARALAAVRHPRVVPLLAVERVREEVFLVLAYAEGGSAQELLEREGPLPPAKALALTQDVLEGLGALHAAGLAHGDVKLANILLDKDGRALVADLGSARATARLDLDHTLTTSPVLGSYATLAPEVLRGGGRSPEADLYAVGAVLYRLLTSRHYVDLEGKDRVAAGEAILHHAPRLPDRKVPAALEPVLLRALAKDPAHRFASAAEMAAAVEAAQARRGRAAPASSPRGRGAGA